MEGVATKIGTRFNPKDKRRKYRCSACKKNPKPSRSCKGCCRLRYAAYERKHPRRRAKGYWRGVNQRRKEYLLAHNRRPDVRAKRRKWFQELAVKDRPRLELYWSRTRYGKEFAEAHRALLQLAKQLKKEN